MNFNIEVRKKQLSSLNQYINSTKDKVDSILNYLGWSAKAILEAPDKIQCPLNKKHIIPIQKIDKHVRQCTLVSSGYEAKEHFLSEPQNNSSSILIDHAKKVEILTEARQQNTKFKPAWNGIDSDPMTSNRYLSTYSADERLAMYDYAVANTEAPLVPSEFTLNIEDSKSNNKTLTEEERLAKERNAKRRPVKYKSVHTGRNKSYTEVMQEVIQNQMEMYKDYLIEKRKAEEEEERKRQQEILEKAQAYEQFPHIDTKVLYDYDIDPFETPDGNYVENSYNSINSFNVNYDYDVKVKIEKDCTESEKEFNYEKSDKSEKRDDYKYKQNSKVSHRDRDRRPRSRDREYKRRSERRSRERREYYPKRSRDSRREPYSRSDRRH